jgi:hypothetical protein
MNGTHYPPLYVELNDTLLTVRINSLPEIPAFLNGATFAENILGHPKTAAVAPIVYVNGSQVVLSNSTFLNSLVSISILPVGNWPFIDSLYPDKSDMEYSCDAYLASLGTSFMIGHRTYVTDSGNGWYAYVGMTTGLPTNATVWASQYSGCTFYSYEITLTPLLAGQNRISIHEDSTLYHRSALSEEIAAITINGKMMVASPMTVS